MWPRALSEHAGQRWLVAAGVCAAAAAVLNETLLTGGALFRRDMSLVFHPLVDAFRHCVWSGAWPVWDPMRGFGQPLLADARAEVLYPPSWLGLSVATWTYQTWFAFFHLLLGGVGTARLLRRMGGSHPAACLAGAAWLLSGPVASIAGQFHHLAGAAWLPWIVAAGLEATQRPGARAAVRLAVPLGLQVLAGSPDYTVASLLATGLLILPRLAATGPRLPRLTTLLGAGCLGLALSAPQWIPSLLAASASERWQQAQQATTTTWSVAPLRLLEILFAQPWSTAAPAGLAAALFRDREPYLASLYLGAVALALASAALPGKPWSLLAISAVSGLLSLGSSTPLYLVAVTLAPPLRMLRYPEKLVVVTALGVALMAGRGFDALRLGSAPARRGFVACSAAVLAAAGVLALLVGPGAPLRAAGLVLIAALALLAPALRARARILIVAGALVVDLFAAHHALNPAAPRSLYTARPSPLELLGPPAAARLYVYDYSVRFTDPSPRPGAEAYALARVPAGWQQNAALVLGVYDYLNPPSAGRWGVRGSFDADIVDLYPAYLARLVNRLRELEPDPAAHARLLRVGGVTHVLALHDAPWASALTPVAALPGLFRRPSLLFRVPDPLPLAYLVGGARPAPDAEAARLLASPDFDPRREILVPEGPSIPAAEVRGRIQELRRLPDRLEFLTESETDGFLVLTEAFDLGWRAWLDGRRVPVLRADLAFRALALPAGEHRLEMRYEPPGLRLGAFLFLAGACAAIVSWRRA